MAQKRKSRDQKIKADSRHKEYHLSAVYTAPKLKKTASINAISDEIIRPQATITSYPYLQKDLSRTLILTAGIIVSQVILFILLNQHTVSFRGMNISY